MSEPQRQVPQWRARLVPGTPPLTGSRVASYQCPCTAHGSHDYSLVSPPPYPVLLRRSAGGIPSRYSVWLYIKCYPSSFESPTPPLTNSMADIDPQTPLLSLLSILTTSIHTIEDELKLASMPTFTLEPLWHPLDSLDTVPSPRLHEARKAAMSSATMIRALVQDVGTALLVRASCIR